MPIFGTLFYINYTQSQYESLRFFLLLFQIIIITFLLPLAFYYFLKSTGKVDSIMASKISERKIPVFFQLVLTIILVQKTTTIDRFFELFFFFDGVIVSLFVIFILLFLKTKVSIHLVGISGLTFFVIGLSVFNEVNLINVISLLFLATGLVASSRLQMKAHTLKEIIFGFLIGSVPQIALWYFWL